MKNKFLYLITSLLFLGIFTMQSQEHQYGFRIGLNYSDINFEDKAIVSGESKARYGFTAGFFAIYNLSRKISIQPEIQFSAQGEKSASTLDASGIQGQFSEDPLRMNLIQIPVLFNYTIAEQFTLSVGPQLGLNIWEWERADDYENVQFSGVAGIAYYITDNISLSLRGIFGITNAIDADNSSSRIINGQVTEPLFVAKGVNHYLQFTVAYSL